MFEHIGGGLAQAHRIILEEAKPKVALSTDQARLFEVIVVGVALLWIKP